MWYRVVSVLFVGCILIRPAAAQQLDTVIHFPDSLGYCYMPTAVLANPLTGRVYVPNGGDVGGVLVFDPATRTKERFLRGYYHDGIYCPNVGKLYLAGESELAVLDATTDSLLRVIPLEYEIGGLVSSPTSGKLYVLPPEDGGEWVVLDAAGDTVLAVLEEVSVATSPVWDTVANRICAVGEDDGVIGILDCFGDTVVAELVVGGGHGLYGLALDPESRRLYCSSETDTMFVADVDSLRFVGAIGGVLVSGPLLYNPVLDRVYGPNYDAMVVVDCRSGSVRRRLTVGYINELALNPVSGRVYVSLYNPPGVVVLDAGDTVAAAIGTADIGTPQALGCAAARSELYCAMQMDNVAVVDCRADTLSGVMDYAQYIIRGIVHGSVGDRLYLLFPDRGLVTALDREYRQVSTLAVPMVDANVFPVYNPGLNRLYIADSARLWVIDCGRDTLLGERSMPGLRRASTALLVPALGKLYVFPRYATYACWVYDCLRDTVTATIPLSQRVTSAAYHPWTNQVYASVYDDSTIWAIDGFADTVVKTLRAGRRNSGNELLANTDNGRLYHFSGSNNRLFTIDVRTNVVVDSVGIPDDGDTIFWYRPADRLYLCDRTTSGVVSVFDCNSGSVTDTLDVPCGYAGALNEATGRLYLGGDSGVVVVDCRSDSVVALLPGAHEPRFSATSPAGNRVYFAARSNWLAVYQDRLGVAGEQPAAGHLRLAPLANPVRGRAVFRCAVPAGEEAVLRVFDAVGRLAGRVPVAGSGAFAEAVWSCTDGSGRRVAAGVYFVRLDAGGQRASVKLVVE